MVFSSLFFVFAFLPLALVVFFGVKIVSHNNRRALNLTLVALSLAFYFWGSGGLLALLLFSILFNWFIGKRIATAFRGKSALLIAGICTNLAFLAYFKYCRFFLDTLGALANKSLAPDLHPALPVGISFYTFMTISYLVEVYRMPREKASLLEFSTYLSLFPHLVAGPIVRFGEVASDMRQRDRLTVDNFFNGIVRFTQGLAMKVLIADNLSPTADYIFGLKPGALGFASSWLGAIAYTFQIYFDFAGYSAMAIGLALMLGFHFPENFNRPYIATSITDFWRRWHMSLSLWLRDYLYIPLGGNRKGNARTYLNLFIVFFVCGLWHGAAWTFVIWGLYHGILLIAERFLKSRWNFEGHGVAGIAVTFFLTIIGWVIFRSESLDGCIRYLKMMFLLADGPKLAESAGALAQFNDSLVLLCLLLAACISFMPWQKLQISLRSGSKPVLVGKVTLTAVGLYLVSMYAIGNTFKPFIYFRF